MNHSLTAKHIIDMVVTGEGSPYKKMVSKTKDIDIDYFEKMWRKNSDAGGGDPFILKNIFYTANGIYVIVKFDV